jgi:hypothetical protein
MPLSTPMEVMPIWMVDMNWVGIHAQRQGRRRAGIAGVGHFLQAGSPGGDQGDFGHGEDPVQQDQAEQKGDFHIGGARHPRL